MVKSENQYTSFYRFVSEFTTFLPADYCNSTAKISPVTALYLATTVGNL
jgi:hypothetical protein